MAQIDVTELLSDPDFIDRMQVISRFPAVSTLGENFIKECSTDSFGSIQPTDGPTLNRLPEGLRNENVSTFWFKGVIVATAPGKYTSVLVFKGQRYQVRHIFDWTNWGQGWCEGICVAEVPS